MKADLQEMVAIPQGVTATVQGRRIKVAGTNGELEREFRTPGVAMEVTDGNIVLTAKAATQRQKNLIKTMRAHLRNLVKGVTDGYEYKLKVCSGHFPMNVSVSGKELVVKNFIGEAVPRKLALKDNATVKLDGDTITVSSADKEAAGQQAAEIEKLCRRPAFDNRIFQDGIYIIEKAGKQL